MRFLARPRWLLLCLTAPVYAGALVGLRGRPTIRSDAGIFLSVGARLLHGDRLYSGVWDNKSPFFYYTYALGLKVAGWRGPFLIDVVWISIAAIFAWLLVAEAGGSSWTSAVAGVTYPLLLTGAWYSAGYSELPALALAPVVGWLWLRGNAALTGVLLGVVAFYRPDYALLFAALLVVPPLVRVRDLVAFPKNALRLLAGLVTAAAVSVGVLAIRGELSGYLHTTRMNFGYPNRAIVQVGEPAGIVGHVRLVAGMVFKDRPRGALFVVVVLALLLLLVAALRRRRGSEPGGSEALLTGWLAGTAVAAALTLALTAVWYHNLELIALPGLFATCVLAAQVERLLRGWRGLAAVTAATAVCVIGLGGLSVDRSSSPDSSRPLSDWTQTPHSVTAAALDEEAAKVSGTRRRVTYARLGGNDDDAHAEFSSSRLKLACPVFHQYTYSANLDEVLACIRKRRPELVAAAPSFVADHRDITRRWDAFVGAGERILHANYIDALTRDEPDGALHVWRLR